MKKISIIGSGTSGMLAAHGLKTRGFDVTVYSDRTADDWLNNSVPTGTAFLYESNIQIERDCGIEHWQDDAFHGHGVLLDFQPTKGADRLVVNGLLHGTRGAAIDIRKRVHRWMNDFEKIGGAINYGAVSVDQLEGIAAESDLTLLSAGKSDISSVVPRDAERSVYSKPQRNLAMILVEGVDKIAGDRVDYTPIKFNFFGDAGEYFWVPYTHKSGKHVWCVLFEAKEGGYMDRFGDAETAEQACEIAKQLIKDVAPYEYDYIQGMYPVEGDAHCWLKGRFPPTVRKAFGKTSRGDVVVPIGDSAITFDPIGGQGGNCSQKNTWHWVQALADRGDLPYAESWLSDTWESFWSKHGKAAYTFNNILLEPLTEAGQTILFAASQNRDFADTAFFGNFHSPTNFFPWFEDTGAANSKIEMFAKAS